MIGPDVVHLDHAPDEAELDEIKQRYLRYGLDVVSVRVVDHVQIPAYRNDWEPLLEDFFTIGR
jgi:hypothetical protein